MSARIRVGLVDDQALFRTGIRMLVSSQADLEFEVANVFTTMNPSGGHGIDGMRERAVLAGGTFSAETRGDIFVITTAIPAMPTAAIAVVK